MDPNQNYNNFSNAVANQNSGTDAYIQDLINTTNGNYNQAAKYIEAEYKKALGTDDSARAAFIKQVANDLEAKVGTIAYDYQTNTYRKQQDIATDTARTTQARDTALQRLGEDEKYYLEQNATQNAQDRQSTAEGLNSRGLSSATYGAAKGLQGKVIGQTETNINGRLDALKRSISNQKEDITTNADQRLADITLNGQRSMEDYATSARRGASGAQSSYDQSLEQAKTLRDRANQQSEILKKSLQKQNAVRANQTILNSFS